MDLTNYKCPNCGSNLAFEPELKKLHCKQCDSSFELAEIANEEKQSLEADYKIETVNPSETDDKKRALNNQDFASGTHGYHCDNCGAEVITENDTASSFCYYCHSPVIFTDKIQGEYRPDKIVPFRINKKTAQEKFLSWTKKYKLLAKGFASLEHLEKMTGIYVPFWLAKATADFDVAGYGERVEVSETSTKTYTTYKKYHFERSGNIDLKEIKTLASVKLNSDLIYSVESPVNSVAEPFNPAYLSGYFSERFSIDKKDVEPETNRRLKQAVDNVIVSQINRYTNLHYTRNQRNIEIEEWQYVLFPIWILTFNFRGKVYVYALNGDTGEFFGELPMDKSRLWKRIAASFAGILAILMLGGQFLW